LQKYGIEFGRHLIMQGSQNACVNRKIFGEYIKLVLLPYVPKIRSKREVEQEESALLMNNCPNCPTSEAIDMITTARVPIVTFGPQTRQIFQLLDLMRFGTFTQVGRYHLPFDDLTLTSRFIDRLDTGSKRTLTPVNIWVAFGGIGIEFERNSAPYRVIFHSEKLTESKAFRYRWEIGFPLDALSTRPRTCRFGWLNTLYESILVRK
jgi:hypothetical protein